MGVYAKREATSSHSSRMVLLSLVAAALIAQPFTVFVGAREAFADPVPVAEPTAWAEPPVLQSPAEDAFSNQADAWFDWYDVDGATSYELKLSHDPAVDEDGALTTDVHDGDFEGTQPTESRARLTGLSGTWYWQVRAVAADDSKGPWATPWKATIDTTPPAFDIANGAIKTSPSVTVTITEEYLGSVTVDGNPATPSGTAPTYTVVISGQGSHTLTATDLAGSSSAVSFSIDSVKPALTINLPQRNADGSYFISGTSDDTADVTVTVAGLTYTLTPVNGSWSFVTPPLSDGVYPIVASSKDAAGNTGDASYAFTATTPLQPGVNEGSTNDPDKAKVDPEDEDTQETPFIAQLFNPDAAAVLDTDSTSTTDTTDDPAAPAKADKDVLEGTAQPNAPAPADDTPSFMGLAWYWWLGIVAVLGGGWWAVAAGRKTTQ